MAKKKSPKEIREQLKKEAREKFQKENRERLAKIDQEKAKKENEEKLRTLKTNLKKSSSSDAVTTKRKKSLAKANGLKSAFVVSDDIYLTANGRGNSAVIEKCIVNDEIKTLNTASPNFDASNNLECIKKLDIKSTRVPCPAVADKPITGIARQDLLETKDLLEKEFFGRPFKNDNIHIQIIYNIRDLQKILAVYSNNIIVTLNNLFRKDKAEYNEDFAGTFGTKNCFEDLIDHVRPANWDPSRRDNLEKMKESFLSLLKSPYIGYFGDTFKKKKNEDDRDYQRRVYNVLALIGELRQVCTHINTDIGNDIRTNAWLYNLDNKMYLRGEFRHVLKSVYKERFDTIQNEFLKTSGININIAQNAVENAFGKTGNMTLDDFIREYYQFTVIKTHKNMGFSIKKLREIMLETKEGVALKENEYNSVRQKLNKTIDFLVYYYYTFIDAGRADSNVKCLRATISDEAKENFYNEEAIFLWDKIGETIMQKVATDVKSLSKDKNFNKNFYKEHKDLELGNISSACEFSQLVFLTTKFLDGKEINDLVTNLINKFENIQSLIDVMSDLGMPCEFVDEYKFFMKSGEVSNELRVINSVARMTKPDESAKKAMYKDALEILGIPDTTTDEQIEKVLQDIVGYNEKGEKTKKKGNNGFRNFIASNVIESDRFKYLVRYSNPKKVRAIASNQKVVSFALEKLPDTQIERYYKNCGGVDNITAKKKAEWLSGKITGISYSVFVNVNNNANVDKADRDENAKDKAQKQALVSLYLTILYHIIKNLVYVNSRFLIGFYSLLRDTMLIKNISLDDEESKRKKNGVVDYCMLTKDYVDNGKLNKHATRYLNKNIQNLYDERPAKDNCTLIDGNRLIRTYRNYVAHLTVVRNADLHIGKIRSFNSYYELYHFLLQSMLKGACSLNESSCVSKTIQGYFYNVSKYGTYCMDFVKALNAPFGYCLARYKNLSIEPLFDRNDLRIQQGQQEWKNGVGGEHDKV